jgi:hypothetical protein
MRTWSCIVACTSLVAGLAFAAAPAAASTVPAAAPKGSCKLLTVREVSGILGTSSGSGRSTTKTVSGVKNESCEWRAKKKGTGGIKGKPLSLEVAVESGGGVVDEYQTQKSEDPLEIEQVPGLGDDAFTEDFGLDLHVLVGERVVSVEMHNYRYPEPLTEEQIKQKEQDAATIALGRLA